MLMSSHVIPCPAHRGEPVRQRGASSAGQLLEALASQGDGAGGREEHLRLLAPEGDDGHLTGTRGNEGGRVRGRRNAKYMGQCWTASECRNNIKGCPMKCLIAHAPSLRSF